jgi:DNA-binding IclR family transcriptional regulator
LLARGGNRHTEQHRRRSGATSPAATANERPVRPDEPPILVLRKAWRVLDAFSPERPTLDFQEIRAATGLPATTCLRLVRNLVSEGLLAQNGDRYRLGLTILRWAAGARAGMRLIDIVLPLLEELRDDSGETAGLFVREGDSRVCVALAETHHAVARRLWIGHALPLHVGSPGKVLLAYDEDGVAGPGRRRLSASTERTITDPRKLEAELEGIRRRSYATSFGEWDLDVSGIAAPVFAGDRRIVGAVAISAPAQRLGPADEERVAPMVVRAALDASVQLAYLPEAPS